ncbi:MAG: acetate--CoA ligase family protein, partial [Spirochaetia bacterium]
DFLNAEDAEKILAAYGLNTAPSVYLPAGASKASDTASEIVFPVVAKIDHPEVIHKSDEGGVLLNIANAAELQARIAELHSRFPGARGVLVQQQLSSATEVILGAIKDPSVGHAEMVGLGGTSVELLGDVAFAHVPFSAEEARRAILSLKSAPLLTGYRGSTPMNLDDLVEKMLRINRLLVDFPEISEIDLNPLLYSFQTSRFYIADFRLRIGE